MFVRCRRESEIGRTEHFLLAIRGRLRFARFALYVIATRVACLPGHSFFAIVSVSGAEIRSSSSSHSVTEECPGRRPLFSTDSMTALIAFCLQRGENCRSQLAPGSSAMKKQGSNMAFSASFCSPASQHCQLSRKKKLRNWLRPVIKR